MGKGRHISGKEAEDMTEERNRKKIQCPVCGYYTLDSSGDFDICPVCCWEDDGLQTYDPIMLGGANGPSLIGGRIYYKKYGMSEKSAADRCRPPREDEKEGLPYRYTEYRYDDRKRILFIKRDNGELCPVLSKYGSGFAPDSIASEAAAHTPEADRWKAIRKKSRRDLKYVRKSDRSTRKLNFAEYVRKLSTGVFKDRVTSLSDADPALFEEAAGHSLSEVLEMDDEECSRTYKKLCAAAAACEKYERLPKLVEGDECELIWDVPEWMEDWG